MRAQIRNAKGPRSAHSLFSHDEVIVVRVSPRSREAQCDYDWVGEEASLPDGVPQTLELCKDFLHATPRGLIQVNEHRSVTTGPPRDVVVTGLDLSQDLSRRDQATLRDHRFKVRPESREHIRRK